MSCGRQPLQDKSFRDDVETALRAAILPHLVQFKAEKSHAAQAGTFLHFKPELGVKVARVTLDSSTPCAPEQELHCKDSSSHSCSARRDPLTVRACCHAEIEGQMELVSHISGTALPWEKAVVLISLDWTGPSCLAVHGKIAPGRDTVCLGSALPGDIEGAARRIPEREPDRA